ncbi:MAG: TatD family deoxyribonuclease [Planctomycetota bacterium]|nr:MAG: TatD family deoxyribonuclease [Planctomycetota bacterium]
MSSPSPAISLFDSHCHLTWQDERHCADTIWQRAQEAGVKQCVTVATDDATAKRCLALSESLPGVSASAGLHPNDAGQEASALDRELQALEALLETGGFVAVGESGLDFYRDWADPELQRRAFRRHLEWSQRFQLPIIVHCRQAAQATLEELQAFGGPIQGVMHCYSEGPDEVEAFLDLGLHVSFAGNLSYPKAEVLRLAAQQVPDHRILIETDAPFLAPQARRGKRNEPAFMVHTLECLAQTRQQSRNELAALTTANAESLFGLSRSPVLD